MSGIAPIARLGAALLACSPLAMAVPTVAQERSAPRASDHRVRIDDLKLSSVEGAARFDQRIERTARSACSGLPTITGMQCRQNLSRELHDALPALHQEEYARARSGRVLAMVPTFSA